MSSVRAGAERDPHNGRSVDRSQEGISHAILEFERFGLKLKELAT